MPEAFRTAPRRPYPFPRRPALARSLAKGLITGFAAWVTLGLGGLPGAAAQELTPQETSSAPSKGEPAQGDTDKSADAPGLSVEAPRGMVVKADPALADVAWDYLEALLLEDHDRARAYLTAESRYQDFSIELFDRDMVDLKGGPAILKYWQESAQTSGTVEVRFDTERHFVAGPNVYFIGTAHVKNLGSTWGLGDELLDFSFTQISHIRIVDGKVTYHADHVDYLTAYEQMQEYMTEAAGRGRPAGGPAKR